MINFITKNKRNMIFVIASMIFAPIIATILLSFVYSIPEFKIKQHAKESIPVFQIEKDYWNWTYGTGYYGTRLDGWTDSVMINTASYSGKENESVLTRALMNYHVDFGEVNNYTDNLIMMLNNDDLSGANIKSYSRYWHGYLIWLKPLLYIMNYQEIRIINMALQFILLVIVILLIYKRDIRILVPFLSAVLFLNPVSLALSLQYSSVYIITLLTVIIMLGISNVSISNNFWKVFLWQGIAIAFFDFLTYPIVSLGLVLIIILPMTSSSSFKDELFFVCENIFFWAVGYAGMWGSKWLIASAFTGYDAIREALFVAKFRVGGLEMSTKEQIKEALVKNFKSLNNPLFYAIVLCLFALGLVGVISKKYKLVCSIKVIGIIIVCLLPILWYIVMRNHSIIHSFMTYRNISIIIEGLLMIIILSIRKMSYEKGH